MKKRKLKPIVLFIMALILIVIGIILILNALNPPKVVFDIPMQSGVKVPK